MYEYDGNVWCDKCGEGLRAIIREEGEESADLIPEDPNNFDSYDSDDYPKGPYPEDDLLMDMPCNCAFAEDCPDAIELENGVFVGKPLAKLSEDGINYVKASEDSPIKRHWIEYYGVK